MSPYFILLISALSVFRLAEFCAIDNGPFHICKKLRGACKGHALMCELITCQYCLGSWLSIIVTAGLVMAKLVEYQHCILWWAGIWGAQAVILRTVRERHE